MNNDLEADLARVIGRAAERAPQAPSDLPARVVSRSRRRRSRTLAAATAVAVVVVAGGVALSVRGLQGAPDVAVHPATPTATTPGLVEQVWPDAVWKIPAKLREGGRKLRPVIFIDDRTLLLETWASHEKADALYAYELDTGRTRKITDIRTPKGVFASAFTAGAGRIFWQTIEDTRTRLWSVPITGGEPAPLPTDAPIRKGADKLVVTGDRLAFSAFQGGGVFTVPLDGGAVTPVKNAVEHHILTWPWVGMPGDYTPDNEPSFKELYNVETGEMSLALVRPGDEYVRCGVTTCVGVGAGGKPFVRLRDGSQERELPDTAMHGLSMDRFMTVSLPTRGQALLDLVTGKSGDLGLRPDAKGAMTSVQPGIRNDRLVWYELKGRLVIIDLARIAGR
ncbi:TolB family protein [[Actinomadura] parvosata]|uniref:TolB family protein n=1 Tax=[Actinomadura] parvosata TaxID=1955412 RepID=UPI00406CFD00